MRAQRKTFAFREDAIGWITNNEFYYVNQFGWCHANGYSAIVEPCGRPQRPWVLTIYRNTVPAKPADWDTRMDRIAS
jgi:hypothetical protein